MEWEEIIGANIRRFRKKREMTQEQLAMAADLDLRYLGGIERGKQNPTVSVLGRLAGALDVHPADFFEENIVG